MSELARRKQPLNLSIVHVDPEGFVAHYLPWLEITAFITAQRLVEATAPADGVPPALTGQQLADGAVHKIGNDTLMAFCMTAAMNGDGAAVDSVEAALLDRLGKDFPGSFGLWHFRGDIPAPVTLDDFVGQAGKKMLAGEIAPPPMRGGEAWNTGLRFLEKAQGSNFKAEILYPLALWTRAKWEEVTDKGVAFMAHIETNLPMLREALQEPRNDAAFIANMLLLGAPAVEIDLQDDVQGMLRSLARR
ncbi:hypothetical protein WSK_1744 [Novosphingobium sp. Rr 2-17]|uniref:hypothetical protein n=1 Tax=Novosphingobium sp. Rr 2-17 TaxID=555793 RepID=UPI000269A4F8|nr:hypothetical protein [Novosphingobium sp. Rr 2-17]EIZ79664.1 hypothetical protein WSK_1744 [Novosphingobium sp. Rr 2-17]